MLSFLRSLPRRWDAKSDAFEINWAHPITDRLIRAVVFTTNSVNTSSQSSLAQELVHQTALQSYTHRVGPNGYVLKLTTSGTCQFGNTNSLDLTPATGAGAGMTIVMGAKQGASSESDSLINKYSTSTGLEWVFGVTTSGPTLYFWVYDSAHTAYIGRKAPPPTGGQYHNWVARWDGGTATSNISIWVDGARIDNADFTSGTFVSVVSGTTIATIGGSNSGTGNTNDLSVDYCYIFRRALTVGEIWDLNDNPYLFMKVQSVGYGRRSASASGWGPLLAGRRSRRVL